MEYYYDELAYEDNFEGQKGGRGKKTAGQSEASSQEEEEKKMTKRTTRAT